MDIIVNFHSDRTKLGTLICPELSMNVPCLGLADHDAATQHGNPTSDPFKSWGNTPVGSWSAMLLNMVWSEQNEHSYGAPDPVNRLIYVLAMQPHFTLQRDGILIHGGDLNPAYKWWGGLRPTHGCVRIANSDIEKLTDFVRKNPQAINVTTLETK